MLKKYNYLVFFLLAFALVCYLLGTPFLGRLFYPLPYKEQITACAAACGVDPLLVAAVIYTESGFNAEAVSPRGARGLMQVMPSTAEWAAEMLGYAAFTPDMLFDPQHNIEIGTWYLGDLLRQFQGSEVIALAAYNGGRNRVRQWLESGTWDGSGESLEQIPLSETRNFVRRALKSYQRYQDLYGTS